MKHIRTIGPLVLLVLAFSLPLITADPAFFSIAIFTLLYASAATGWNIFSGYSSYISLGYAAFTGIGGYTLAIICDRWQIPGGYTPFLFVPVAGLVAALIAIPMGWVALRTRRVTFVVVTIAMSFILLSLALNLRPLTNGSSGILLPASEWSGDFYNMPYYYAALFLFLVAFAISWWIRNSKFGLGLLAIRDDENRAAGLGVQTWSFKLCAFIISAFIGGMVGALLTYFSGTIFPTTAFAAITNVSVALMAFLGGVGTLKGPVIGAFLFIPFQQFLNIQYGNLGLNLIILGVLLLFVILFLPEGVLVSLSKAWTKYKAMQELTSPEKDKPLIIEGDNI